MAAQGDGKDGSHIISNVGQRMKINKVVGDKIAKIDNSPYIIKRSLIHDSGNGLFANKDFEIGETINYLMSVRINDFCYFGQFVHNYGKIDMNDYKKRFDIYMKVSKLKANVKDLDTVKIVGNKLFPAPHSTIVIKPIKKGEEIYRTYGYEWIAKTIKWIIKEYDLIECVSILLDFIRLDGGIDELLKCLFMLQSFLNEKVYNDFLYLDGVQTILEKAGIHLKSTKEDD